MRIRLLVLLTLAGCVAPEGAGPGSSLPPVPGSVGGDPTLPACPDGPLFTTIPVDLAEVLGVRPLGFLAPPIHILGAKHMSFPINKPGETRVGLEVRFPSEATVTLVTRTSGPQGTGYQLTFYPCREYKAYFFHLGTVSDDLRAAFDASSPRCYSLDAGRGGVLEKCEAAIHVTVHEGDVAGTHDGSGGVDFSGVDRRMAPHALANASRYDGDYPFYVPFTEAYAPGPLAQLEAVIGSWDGSVRRTAQPLGGTIAHDVPGTAQGNWFPPGRTFMNTQDFSSFLSLTHDYVEPSEPVFSMGNSTPGVSLGLYSFTPRASGFVNRDFDDVRPGATYCYDSFRSGTTTGKLPLGSINGVLLVEMPTSATLRMERLAHATCGDGPWSLTSAAAHYER